MCMCVSVCPSLRPVITSGVIWCDIDHVQLVKQVLWCGRFNTARSECLPMKTKVSRY